MGPFNRSKYATVLLFAAAFLVPLRTIVAAKKILIMDFRNLDNDPNFQYLEASLTDSVRQYLHERYEIFEPEPGDVYRRARDGAMLFPEEFHNKNVALQLGILLDQDVVLSGGFRQHHSDSGTSVITVDVMILDVEHKSLVKRFKGDVKVDANLFDSIKKLSVRVADEAKTVLPNKGQFDFDLYAPGTQNQLSIFGGYNLNGMLTELRKNQTLANRTAIVPGDTGGLFIAVEYRRDRFLAKNRLIGFVRIDGTLLDSRNQIAGSSDTAKLSGFTLAIEPGIGYQLFRYKRLFINAMMGAGGLYSRMQVDFGGAAFIPAGTKTGTQQASYSGEIFGPTASLGVRSGLQLNPTLSIEIGAMYQQWFLNGATGGNLTTLIGIGVRL